MLSHLTEILHREGVGLCVRCDETGEPIYDEMIWESDTHPRPTLEEFNAAVEKARQMVYRDRRREAYPSIADQLDVLYHEGIEGWREIITSVKEQFPKPE